MSNVTSSIHHTKDINLIWATLGRPPIAKTLPFTPPHCSVNFNKMIPKAGVFKQSEVFKTLNSELVQSEEEDKKWTTFLQKPSRPPPKTPEERKLERNPPTERYQVRIVKQPKPKIAPDYKPPKSPVSVVRHVRHPRKAEV